MVGKKIVLVIVEGPTDDDALGVIFQRFFDDNTVRVEVVHGDITAERFVNSSNILKRIKEIVQHSLDYYKLRKTDLLRIIHLVDTDGAFVPNSAIQLDKEASKPIYSVTNIKTNNPQKVVQRNAQKKENLTKLHSANYIWNSIPYSVFYLSSNLDHALYNELNLTDEEKEKKALEFAEEYIDNISAFVKFIRESEFSVVDDYLSSWSFIKQDLHSLERHSNLGICFDIEEDTKNK